MSLINPWQKLSARNVYENAWIRVEHHEVITPGNTPGIYGKVHFKNLAIGIIPLDNEGNTWLVGQHRYTLDLYSWEIPMGGGELGTDAKISAARELSEETGICCNNLELLLEVHTSNSVTDETGLVFLATDLQFENPKFDITEDIAIKKIKFEEACNWVMEGKITDALSVAGILKLFAIRTNLSNQPLPSQ